MAKIMVMAKMAMRTRDELLLVDFLVAILLQLRFYCLG